MVPAKLMYRLDDTRLVEELKAGLGVEPEDELGAVALEEFNVALAEPGAAIGVEPAAELETELEAEPEGEVGGKLVYALVG